jgi:hypothetical protein
MLLFQHSLVSKFTGTRIFDMGENFKAIYARLGMLVGLVSALHEGGGTRTSMPSRHIAC